MAILAILILFAIHPKLYLTLSTSQDLNTGTSIRILSVS